MFSRFAHSLFLSSMLQTPRRFLRSSRFNAKESFNHQLRKQTLFSSFKPRTTLREHCCIRVTVTIHRRHSSTTGAHTIAGPHVALLGTPWFTGLTHFPRLLSLVGVPLRLVFRRLCARLACATDFVSGALRILGLRIRLPPGTNHDATMLHDPTSKSGTCVHALGVPWAALKAVLGRTCAASRICAIC